MIFLRGAVPPASEHPEKLLYDRIEECEDVWTQLFYYTLKRCGAKGELLYRGGNRTHVVDDCFVERWIPSFKHYKPQKQPDVILCRGGFPYYDPIITKFKNAKRIYYGAGKRFYPTGFDGYDLFLVDSQNQLDKIKRRNKNVRLFIKPAATLFKPVKAKKRFDVCFMANGVQARIKRHILLLESLSGSKLRVLNLGNKDKKLIKMAKALKVNIQWGGWSLRKDLPAKISQCKVGVCCSTNYDSCPRVIPEYLACGLPVVATNNINFWHDKYITPHTGAIVPDKKLLRGIEKVLARKLDPTAYYNENLSIDAASSYLATLIGGIL